MNKSSPPSWILVSPGHVTEQTDPSTFEAMGLKDSLAPALGIHVVAEILRQEGVHISLLQTDLLYAAHLLGGQDPADFSTLLAERIRRQAPVGSTVGFSTICSSYPLTLSTVEILAKLRPDLTLILGGPQATATAVETMAAFPSVDAILGGEVELSLPEFLAAGSVSPGEIPGLCWRDDSGDVHLNPAAPPVELEDFVSPALDLWDGPRLEPIPIEAGRGCPFRCRFCSTSGFFQRRFRLKSPKQLVEEVTALRKEHSFKKVEFIHDNFGANRKQLRQFCRLWTESKATTDLQWSCSLRPSKVDSALARLLKESGCHSVFVGLETGSERLQKVIGKDLDVAEALEAIEELSAAGVAASVSFIVGFPEETAQDLEETLDAYSRCMELPGVSPQMQVLSPLPGSSYHAQCREHLALDSHYSSMVHQSGGLPEENLEQIQRYPEIHSAFYAVPTQIPRLELVLVQGFLKYGRRDFALWVRLMVHALGSLNAVVDSWSNWWRQHRNSAPGEHYFAGKEFRSDFLEWMDSSELTNRIAPERLDGFSKLNALFRSVRNAQEALRGGQCSRISVASGELTGETVIACMGMVVPSPFHLGALLAMMQRGEDPFLAPSSVHHVVVARQPRGEWLIEQLEPLALACLEAAGAGNSVATTLGKLVADPRLPAIEGVSSQDVAIYSVQRLLQRQILGQKEPSTSVK